MEIDNIIDSIKEKKLNELNTYGHILSGHNGPYYDTDTPVRNTAHWATIFSYYYKKTQEKKYFNAVKTCGEYLVSKGARPMNASFFCRYNTVKDSANGTIGTAWAIEGLVSAYDIVKDKEYLEVAKEVFLLFPFDERYNLWKIIDVDGSIRGFDMTFNHQLWFATSGIILSTVLNDKEINRRCNRFFEDIENIFNVYKNGLVKHSILTRIGMADRIWSFLKRTRYCYRMIKTHKSMKYRENGYHLFNIYAFALIKDYGFELDLFKTEKFKKSLNYCFSEELYKWLEKKDIKHDINVMPKVINRKINIYGYSYNAPGFEMPYIYRVFSSRLGDKSEFVKKVVRKQVDLTFDKKSMSFCKNNDDEIILNARLYEYIRSLTV